MVRQGKATKTFGKDEADVRRYFTDRRLGAAARFHVGERAVFAAEGISGKAVLFRRGYGMIAAGRFTLWTFRKKEEMPCNISLR